MLDVKQNAGKMTESLSKLEGTLFTNFAKPYLDFIGKGKLFYLIYTIMAIINLLLPFAVIFTVIQSDLAGIGGARFIFTFILSWIVITFACWIGFQLWWDRKSKVKYFENSEFVVTHIFSEIVQTFGEWAGTMIGIIGAGVGLIAAVILGDYARYLFRVIGMGFLPSGIIVVVAGPLIGFLIIIFSRFVAEQMRLLATLVNNTKYIAISIKASKAGPPVSAPIIPQAKEKKE
jgi:hypothetical protein